MFKVIDLGKAKETLQAMQERQNEIRKIEASVAELHAVFVEMATLMDQQGSKINRIAEYVRQTEGYTETAAQQTEQAVEKKRALRKKKWFIALISLVIIGIIVGVVFISIKA